jgi:mannose-6-phosphate isomerase
MSIRLLAPEFVERIWGTNQLSPLFPDQDKKIGEVWFNAGPAFPLLIKFLFTSDKLSVQVHPDDTYARREENSRGKTEMWHILSAQPDSTIALGFKEALTTNEVRHAIDQGALDAKLKMLPVKAGDTFFVEAGTVHAIGAGITLCEIQQNSDVTYRLYDYRRGRELHVEKGLAVAHTGTYEGRREFPVICDQFNVDLISLEEPKGCAAGCDGVLVVLEGSGLIEDTPVRAGQAILVAADEKSVQIVPDRRLKLLHARCPGES